MSGWGDFNYRVSIADAILFGFKPGILIWIPGYINVSIADAILFGFKPLKILPFHWKNTVSIADAILFGFKPVRRPACRFLKSFNR